MRVTAALLVACLAVLAGCAGMGLGNDGAFQSDGQSTHTTTDTEENVSAAFVTDGNRTSVTLEVANSPDERSHGLMYRRSLPRNHGMLFVFGEATTQSFWMKNTLIPLDIIFVSANGTVINVAHADPQPEASDSQLRSYTSEAPAKYVVEMRQGFANRTGIEPGTKLVFGGSRPTVEAS
ncbi:DUF192 domain-containing protein [Haladaptatus salinisoli]|uniref:DUF192 domain-containing protein n=1 Tax=Haladaptatus salinisoli TaxID=2884876 RepID=UPI001D0BD178|nr:DUF192 domain-containing protein [Haladaptatus salinisoli]